MKRVNIVKVRVLVRRRAANGRALAQTVRSETKLKSPTVNHHGDNNELRHLQGGDGEALAQRAQRGGRSLDLDLPSLPSLPSEAANVEDPKPPARTKKYTKNPKNTGECIERGGWGPPVGRGGSPGRWIRELGRSRVGHPYPRSRRPVYTMVGGWRHETRVGNHHQQTTGSETLTGCYRRDCVPLVSSVLSDWGRAQHHEGCRISPDLVAFGGGSDIGGG